MLGNSYSTWVSISHALFYKTALFVGAFAPAVAGFIVRKWITREGFAGAGLRPNLRKWPYYLVAWLYRRWWLGALSS